MAKEKTIIQLSDHFDYKTLLRFTLPSVLVIIFFSIKGIDNKTTIIIPTIYVLV